MAKLDAMLKTLHAPPEEFPKLFLTITYNAILPMPTKTVCGS